MADVQYSYYALQAGNTSTMPTITAEVPLTKAVSPYLLQLPGSASG